MRNRCVISLDAAHFLEVIEEVFALVPLRLAVLHGISTQVVVQLDSLDGRCTSLVLM